MTKGLFAVLAFLAVPACGDGLAEIDNASKGVPPGITFVEEYGFCADRCYSELRLTDDGAGRLTVRQRRDGDVRLQRTFVVSPAERDALFGLAHAAATQTWEPIYGCPDCVDQGVFGLSFRAGATVQRTVLDPQEHPAHFDALITDLRALLVRERS